MSVDLLVFGSVNTDLAVRVPHFPAPGETIGGTTLSRSVGGKSANQAAAGALAGAATAFLGRIGQDEAGSQALSALQSRGVDVSGVRACATATGTAVITVRDDGENTIVVVPGANGQLTADDCPDELLAAAGWVLLGLEVSPEAVASIASRAKRLGTRVAFNPSPVPEVPFPLQDIDLLIVNEGEAAELLGAAGRGNPGQGDARDAEQAGPVDPAGPAEIPGSGPLRDGGAPHPPDAVMDAVADVLGVDTVVITRGSRGALIVEQGGGTGTVEAVVVEAVDTTGCGDAFAGVLVGRLARGDEMPVAAGRAARFAAAAATGHGAMESYPTRISW